MKPAAPKEEKPVVTAKEEKKIEKPAEVIKPKVEEKKVEKPKVEEAKKAEKAVVAA